MLTNKINVVFTLANYGILNFIECKREVKAMKRSLLDIIFKKPGVPIYEKVFKTSDLSDNAEIAEIQKEAFDYFKERLDENESVYFYIIGYTPSQKPLTEKNFSKESFSYEDITKLYGCYKSGRVTNYINNTSESVTETAPQWKIIVSHIERAIPENGLYLSYNTEIIKKRCEQIGVDSSYIVGRDTFTTEELKNTEFLKQYCKEHFFDKGIPAVFLHSQSDIFNLFFKKEGE